jgi:hypothetical protein
MKPKKPGTADAGPRVQEVLHSLQVDLAFGLEAIEKLRGELLTDVVEAQMRVLELAHTLYQGSREDPPAPKGSLMDRFYQACAHLEAVSCRRPKLGADPARAPICRVHDADDVVEGRICGRPLPCPEHP